MIFSKLKLRASAVSNAPVTVGSSAQAAAETVAKLVAANPLTRGLQGPTIANIVSPDGHDNKLFSVTIVVAKKDLVKSIAELRAIGGSGVIVTPISYIFEEEPERYKAMLEAIEK